MSFIRNVVGALCLVSLAVSAEPLKGDDIKDKPREYVEAALPESHPMFYYLYSGRSFNEGRKDEAVMWYYVGELRYRFFLAAGGPEAKSKDQGIFPLIRSVVSQLVIDWAGGSPADWANSIDEALKWDEQNANPLASKVQFPKEYELDRNEARKQRDWIRASVGYIREQRASRGLENR